jgi:hypothetical protein
MDSRMDDRWRTSMPIDHQTQIRPSQILSKLGEESTRFGEVE